jgi:hypothetical protein
VIKPIRARLPQRRLDDGERILGLARDVIMAALLGTGPVPRPS